MIIDAMQKALIAIEFAYGGEPAAALEKEAIDALRQAIEQAEKQEPVGYLFDFTCDDELVKDWFVLTDYPTVWEKSAHNIRPLYTVSQREWVGLTDEEIAEAVGSPVDEVYLADFRKVVAKLRQKNAYGWQSVENPSEYLDELRGGADLCGND